MKMIVILLTVSTIIALLIASSKSNTIHTFHQIIPKGTIEVSFLIAFLGWMPAPLDVSVWQSLWAIEKQKDSTIKFDCKQAVFDFNIGFFSTLLLGICFVGLGAFVMFNSGETFSPKTGEFSKQLIILYTSNLGNEWFILIASAAFITMFSTTITTLDASPRAMTKTLDLLTNKPYKNMYWLWMLFLAIGTMIILIYFIGEMRILVKIATILSFLTAPFFAIANFTLISGKHTPKEHHPSTIIKILSWIGIIFLIGFSIWYSLNL